MSEDFSIMLIFIKAFAPIVILPLIVLFGIVACAYRFVIDEIEYRRLHERD